MKSFYVSGAVAWSALLYLTAAPAQGQNFFDQLRQQIGSELQRAGESQTFRPPSSPPGNTPPAQQYSVPNESGQQNNAGNFFRDDGFFVPDSSNRPPRVVSPQPRYPQRASPQQSYPQSSVLDDPPVRRDDPTNEDFKVRAPESMAATVSYRLISGDSVYPYTIAPGQAQTVTESRRWTIRYVRGNREVSYRLRGGNTYEFGIDSSGLVQLYKLDPHDAEPPTKRVSGNR